jgi:flagellar motor switch protein FliG
VDQRGLIDMAETATPTEETVVAEVAPTQATPTPPPVPLPRLTGMQKAVTLMISVGKERASQILAHLDSDEQQALLIEVARRDTVDPVHVDSVMSEVIETAIAQGYLATGGVDYAREMLEAAFGPEHASEVMARLQTTIEVKPFKFLLRTPAEQIYGFVRRENPQLVAVVLSHIGEALAAKVIEFFPEQQRTEIFVRIAEMTAISPDTLTQLEDSIRQRMHHVSGGSATAAGGVEKAAALLNRVDRQTEGLVFDELTERSPAMADDIRRLLFVFEDIASLEVRAIQKIVQACDPADMALALRGTDQSLQDSFLQNMSERAAEQLREEMEIMPRQRKKDVQEAQSRIVSVARRLEESGDIVIFRGGDADEVV